MSQDTKRPTPDEIAAAARAQTDALNQGGEVLPPEGPKNEPGQPPIAQAVEAETVEPEVDRTVVEDASAPARAGGISLYNERPTTAFNPQTTEELKSLVGVIIKGGVVPKGYQFKDGRADPAKMAVGILAGREVGYGPMMALRSIMIVNGMPSMWGQGLKALLQSKNVIERYVKAWVDVTTLREIASKPTVADLAAMETAGEKIIYDDGAKWIAAKPLQIPSSTITIDKWPREFGCVVVMKRRHVDGPYVARFSVGDAVRANLWNNPKKNLYFQYPQDMLYHRAYARCAGDGFSDCTMGIAIRELIDEGDDEAAPPVDTSFLDDGPKTGAP